MISALILLVATPTAESCVSGSDQAEAVCLSELGERADKKLNEVWREAKVKALAADRELREGSGVPHRTPNISQDLLAAQRAWLKFRETQCALDSDSALGTLGPVLYAQCYLRMTEERIRVLQHILEV